MNKDINTNNDINKIKTPLLSRNYYNLKKIIEALPSSFNHYLLNSDTNYKEEILITAWDEDVINDIEAHKLIDELFNGRMLLHKIINRELTVIMGKYVEV